MSVSLAGQTISAVECPGLLDVSTAEGGVLRIENDYEVEVPGRAGLRTVDGEEEAAVEALTALVGTQIVATEATPTGGLVVRLDGGVTIRVDMSASFESWSMVGPAKEMVVSMPGGELAVWS